MAARELVPSVPVTAACRALGLPRATFYRRTRPRPAGPREVGSPASPPRRLEEQERRQVLDLMHSPRFVDKAPAEICATLLDEGVYVCSERTMYRLLEEAGEVRERRDQLRHPPAPCPQLVARAPNQVWSWDITKLKGPRKWLLFYLYVVLDIFSRYVVGWMLADRENGALAQKLLRETFSKQGIAQGTLTVHADRGSPMTSKDLRDLLDDLGVARSHSRPHVSNDNPFSESQFKTLKYRPEFPDRFASFEQAQALCRRFFRWYNHEHHHSGIAYLTPADVHDGRAGEILEARDHILRAAYHKHPERFVHGPPASRRLPPEVWINPPALEVGGKEDLH